MRSRDGTVKLGAESAQPSAFGKPTIPAQGLGMAGAPLAPSAFSMNPSVPTFGTGAGTAGGGTLGAVAGFKPTMSSYNVGNNGAFGTNFGGASGFGTGASGFGAGAAGFGGANTYGNANMS